MLRYLYLLVLLLMLVIGPGSASAALQPKLTKIFKRYGIQDASISIDIVSIKTGQSLFRHQNQRALNPASVMKLLTTVAAFETLGPTHRYPTELYTRPDEQEELSALWVKGYGNPALVDEELRWIAKSLVKKGVRKIKGPIYVDDSYFGAAEPIRFSGTTGKKSVYRVITGALSYNFNRPESLLAAARSYKKNGSYAQRTEEVPERHSLLNREILDPALFTGLAIKNALQQEGIPVTGKVRFNKVPDDSQLLLFHTSQKLAEILSGLNKFSNNFIAEQVLRSLGAARFGNASRQRGLSVLEETLKKIGVAKGHYKLHNGSGLSRHNRLSSAQLTAMLRHALRAPYGEAFTRALSIAGVDGTLQKRFHSSPFRGKLWAKTGTLYQVSALAGFFLIADEPYAFAILVNGFKTGPASVERAQRAILEIFAKHISEMETA